MAKAAEKKVVKVAAPVLTTAQKCEAHGIREVCDRIADCVPLRVIASDIGVSKSMLLEWLGGYADQYARAREAQADKMAEDILSIADEVTVEAKYQGEDVTLDISSSAVARNKLRVDARRWLAGKMAPKKYGDKVVNEHTGELTTTLNIAFKRPNDR